MVENLVIVESPAKARTISNFLGNEYVVLASFGHIRDLPKNQLGYNPDKDFEPTYIVSKDKLKVVKNLKDHISENTTIYLAADEDREGEAIAWHLIPTLKIQNHKIKRIVFHEITKPAIMHAIENPRELDLNLVNAQQNRRILDRAVGYELSPLLWKKVRYGLSAGRVQSVAVRIIVDRENEILAFEPEEYWKIKAEFINPELKSDLVKMDGKVIKFNTFDDVDKIKDDLETCDYILEDIIEKDSIRKPSPPFTTSTLQQEAARKLSMSVKNTMSTAQQLYEGNVGHIPNHKGGLITYMRTDSTNLSKLATSAAKELIEEEYGHAYALQHPREYNAKAKGAQEAHEAIRPVNLKLKPSDIHPYLDEYQFKLYSLIWKRTIATQMAEAKVGNTTYKIKAGKKGNFEFVSKGQRIIFDGFMKAYTEGNDNDTSDGDDKILPTIAKGTVLNFDRLLCEQNWTKPPSRYTEASLVKKMETEGIGRPSTYASTISTIQQRSYVITNEEKKLQPTEIGQIITKFLKEHFPNIVDVGFTANIENEFDKVAEGKIKWTEVMHNFYDDFKKTLKLKEDTIEKGSYLQARELGLEPKTKHIVSVGVGKFGPYVKITDPENEKEKPRFANIPKEVNKDTLTLEEALKLFSLPRNLNDKIIVNTGRFGPYAKLGKNFYNLKDEDPYTITLERVEEIIKTIDAEKASLMVKDFGKKETFILNGKYGPYIKQGKGNYKIPKDKVAEELTFEEVEEIITKSNKAGKKTFRKFKRR